MSVCVWGWQFSCLCIRGILVFSWSGFCAWSPRCCSGCPSRRSCCNHASPGCNEPPCSLAPGTPPTLNTSRAKGSVFSHQQIGQKSDFWKLFIGHIMWSKGPEQQQKQLLRLCLDSLLHLRSTKHADGGHPVEAVAAHQIGDIILELHLLPGETSSLKQLSFGRIVVLLKKTNV